MPKRKDENEIAFDALQQILRRDAERDGIPQEDIPAPEKVSYRVEAGRKGGLIAAQTRNKKLSARKRKKIAENAANTRWHKKK
jgi:hypothetical protein